MKKTPELPPDALNPLLSKNFVSKNTYNAIKMLLDNSYVAQESPAIKQRLSNMSPLAWSKEYCTIKACSTRQSGQSTAICKLGYEYFNRVLYLSPNAHMSESLMSLFLETHDLGGYCRLNDPSTPVKMIHVGQDSLYRFYTYSHLHPKHYLELELDAVIVDGTFGMTSSIEDEIYAGIGHCMEHNPQRFFIFVQ